MKTAWIVLYILAFAAIIGGVFYFDPEPAQCMQQSYLPC